MGSSAAVGLMVMRCMDSKSVTRAAAIAAVLLLLIIGRRSGSASAVRLGLGVLLLYGGVSLAGSFMEKMWRAVRRYAEKRNVRFPRLAAVVVVMSVLYGVAVVVQVMYEAPCGRMTSAIAAEGFLLIGGCVSGGRLLSKLSDVCIGLFHKFFTAGGEAR